MAALSGGRRSATSSSNGYSAVLGASRIVLSQQTPPSDRKSCPVNEIRQVFDIRAIISRGSHIKTVVSVKFCKLGLC